MSAEGSVFKRKEGKWCAKYKDASGKWTFLYRKTRGETKAVHKKALKDREDGIIPTDLTVNDALEPWLKNAQHTVSSRT